MGRRRATVIIMPEAERGALRIGRLKRVEILRVVRLLSEHPDVGVRVREGVKRLVSDSKVVFYYTRDAHEVKIVAVLPAESDRSTWEDPQ